ncbi:hypothetical protein LK540_14555 [Massilia sp. IC2-278]|uniref:hypothetical protein n=1 Tax=Massilia sp. IC2-278 TaxID=2887200 RepID=UPI001E319FC4|nr:hypothetical protein [Massilia sp. IC2-278]MCC2961648.1 hypothetical protein [Massilia sp. IC2-278]
MNQPVAAAPRIAVLVDCDNTSPEALEYRIVPKQQGYASLGKMIADCAALQTQTTNGTTTVRLINAPGNPANVTAIRPTAK